MNADNVAGSRAAAGETGAAGLAAGKGERSLLIDSLCQALRRGALAHELESFSEAETEAAAEFISACAARRPPGIALVRLESVGTQLGRRRMRIGIINDDMPFLVDSLAGAIAARGLIIHRLLHPVVCVRRDDHGNLTAVEPLCDDLGRRESIMYIEVDRADARTRTELLAELHRALADVRAAVTDWRAMQQRMRDDADSIEGDEEGAALLRWFADGAMTLLAYHVERPAGPPTDPLGLFKLPGDPTDEGGCMDAIRYFEQGGATPLMAKADRRSTVHRRVPLDLVVVPVREKGKIVGVGVHAGLWTSQALGAPVEEVPLLRRRLEELEREFGFDPNGHSGKALRHAVTSLPHDLLINLSREAVKALVVTAMSLADRPRPTLTLVRSILRGHLFAFVWLPRDELTTRRRVAISEMIERASAGKTTNWSVDLGDGDLASLRFTLALDPDRPDPDVAELDRRLDVMVRGWEPNVEEALGALVGPGRATRLALTYLGRFPEGYRIRTSSEDAAADVVRIDGLEDAAARDVRLVARDGDAPERLHLKIYRCGAIIPLSEAVPVLENFGFRVLEEVPTTLPGNELAYVHDFVLELARGGTGSAVLGRARLVERAIAAVLECRAENDAFNQLIVSTGPTRSSGRSPACSAERTRTTNSTS